MNFKVSILSAVILIANTVSGQLKPYTIQGKIDGRNDGYIYLSYQDDDQGKKVEDSALIKDGKFEFKGYINGVTQAFILSNKINKVGRNGFFQVLLSPGKLKLSIKNDDFSNGILSGTPVQEEMTRLNQSKAQLMSELMLLTQAYEKANMAYIAAMKEKKDDATIAELKETATKAKNATGPVVSQIIQKDREFMEQYPSSYVTATILRGSVTRMPVQQSTNLYEKLSAEVKNSAIGRALYRDIEKLQKGSAGVVAASFSSTELRGGLLNLSDYKGKYVLVDFWASWCIPCRQGNPHLLSLYSQYKDKGFEIIGISDDDSNPEAWKKAVEKDQIGVWKHILRGLKKGSGGDYDRSNSINDKYAVNTLPTKILIDPTGKIIGRYGADGEGENAMDKKLSQIFSSSTKQ